MPIYADVVVSAKSSRLNKSAQRLGIGCAKNFKNLTFAQESLNLNAIF